jgi:hypothetical protein
VIDENALWYKRGDLVEFKLNLAGGAKTCRGLVLNTAVLFGRGARQLWIVDMDDATPEETARWTSKKYIIGENEIGCLIPSVLIGRDTLLRDNPICYPVQNGADVMEIPTVTVNVALPLPPDPCVENEKKNE